MIFAHGTLLPDSALPALLDGLEEEINATRATRSLSPETVISALDELGKRLESGEFDVWTTCSPCSGGRPWSTS